jgi:hypothetical protein
MIRLTRAGLLLLCAALLLAVVAAPTHWASLLTVLLLPYWFFVALAPCFNCPVVEQSCLPRSCPVLAVLSSRPPPVQ